MGDLSGQIKLLDKFEGLDPKLTQRSGFWVTPTNKYDQLKVKPLDKVEIKQNFFIQFSDKNIKGSDLTIIPLEISYEFL
jgi:hypothetical protein